MYYRRKSYKIKLTFLDEFNRLFTDINLPNQVKHGATLVGRWSAKLDSDIAEVFAIWEYDSEEEYQRIANSIRNDKEHQARLNVWFEERGGKSQLLEKYIFEVAEQEIVKTTL